MGVKSFRVGTRVSLLALLGAAACATNGSPAGGTVGSTEGRIHLVNTPLPLSKAKAGGLTPQDFSSSDATAFSYVASVEAPRNPSTGRRVQATNFAFSGSNAFVVYNTAGDETAGALDIVDLSTPGAPVLLSSTLFTDAEFADVKVVGHFAYLAGRRSDGAGKAAILVVDIGDLGSPRTVAVVDVPGHYATSLAVDGASIYASTGDDGGVVQLDASSPGAPTVVASTDLAYAVDVVRANGKTFALGGAHASIEVGATVDVAPLAVISGTSVAAPSRMVVVGNRIFTNAAHTGLHVVDSSSGAITYSAFLEGTGNGIDVGSGLAFLAQGEKGTTVFDVSAPDAPQALGAFEFSDEPGSANEVRYGESAGQKFVFLSDGLDGFRIVEYGTPGSAGTSRDDAGSESAADSGGGTLGADGGASGAGGDGGSAGTGADGGSAPRDAWFPANVGLNAGLVSALVADPTDSHVRFAGTDDGLYGSTNSGSSWSSVGLGGSVIGALSFTSSGVLLAAVGASATTGATVASSADRGKTWSRATGIPADIHRFSGLAAAPSRPQIVYATVSGNGMSSPGLWKSTDGGASFVKVLTDDVYSVAVHPTDPNTLLIALQYGGVKKSVDGGVTFVSAAAGASGDAGGRAVAFDPVSPSIAYYGQQSYPSFGINRSNDGASTWRSSNLGSDAYPGVFSIESTNPNNVYAGGYMGAVYRSSDRGVTWARSGTAPGFGGDVRALLVDPDASSTLWAGTGMGYRLGFGIVRSLDRGATWNLANEGLTAAQVDCLLIDPHTPTTLYSNVAGVSKSTNGGATWTRSVDGLAADSPVTALALSPSNPATLYASNNYQGLFRSRDGGASWARMTSFSYSYYAYQIAVDPVDDATIYVGALGSGLMKSTDAGASWKVIAPSPNSFAVAPSMRSTLYATTNTGLSKSLDGGTTWSQMIAGSFYGMAVDSHDSNRVFVVENSGAGKVYLSADGGLTWQQVSQFSGAQGGAPLGVVLDPSSPSTVYVPFQAGGIVKSNDSGRSWHTLSHEQLPVVQVAVLDPSNPSTVYAGTGGRGVYKSVSGGE